MARAKKVTPRKLAWQPHPDDAIRLAAMRWFALEIERAAIEIYASDKTKYAAMERVLRKALREMAKVGGQVKRLSLGSEDCPNGYLLCKDGICSPMCDWFTDNV